MERRSGGGCRQEEEEERKARQGVQNCTCGGEAAGVTPESTDGEEDTSDVEVNLPGDDEAVTGADSPPVYQEAGDEDAPTTLREARPTPGLLVDPPLAGAERRSPTPAAGGRSSTTVTE